VDRKRLALVSRCGPPVDIGNMEAQRADSGEAGASARRELERRRAAMHASRPTGLAGAVAFFLGPSATQKRQAREVKSWDTGARGEQILAKHLADRCAEVLVLHDRGMPGSRANIDHIAVAASGVYVIDAKRYKGKIRIARPLFRIPRLVIAGRDRTKLIEGLSKQVAVVESIVADVVPGVPVHGCLCFLNPDGFMAESGLPVLRTLEIGGYRLLSSRRLAKRLNASGSLTRDEALSIYTRLAERLRAA
jgi:Nuclease-related domain